MKPFLVVDGQISLHLARHELAEAVFAAVDENRAYLRPWLPWVDGVLSLADTKTFIQASMQQNSEGSRLTLFIMYEGQMAGSLGVVAFNKDHRKCEIGYWLRQDLQGRGILTKALAAFVGFLFQKKAMNRLEIHVLAGNEKSRSVPLRLEFCLEGSLRKSVFMYGEFHDVEIFSLLKEDWGTGKQA